MSVGASGGRAVAAAGVGDALRAEFHRLFDAFAQSTYGAPRSLSLSMRYAF